MAATPTIPPSSAEVQRMPGAGVTAEVMRVESQDPEDVQIWSVVGNSAVPLRGIPEATRKEILATHALAQSVIKGRSPQASRVVVDYSAFSVSFKDDVGNTRTIWLRDFKDQTTFVGKMESAQRLLGNHVAFSTTADPSIDSNRPINVPPPLQKTTATWQKTHTNMSAETFIKRFHPDEDAKDPIHLTGIFITNFRKKLEEKIKEKAGIVCNLNQPDQRQDREKIQKEIEQLQELEARFNNLDTFAIFMNVMHLSKRNPQTPEEQEKTAREIYSDTVAKLQERRNELADKNTLRIITRALSGPDITSYGIDVAGLCLHDRGEHNVVRRSLQQDHRRELDFDRRHLEVSSSAEEFVVYAITNMETARNDQRLEALSSLALNPNMRGIIQEILRSDWESLFEEPSSANSASAAAVAAPPPAAIPPRAAITPSPGARPASPAPGETASQYASAPSSLAGSRVPSPAPPDAGSAAAAPAPAGPTSPPPEEDREPPDIPRALSPAPEAVPTPV